LPGHRKVTGELVGDDLGDRWRPPAPAVAHGAASLYADLVYKISHNSAPLFQGVSFLGVPIVDADAHVNEPPDLWEKRVSAKHRARAPRVAHEPDGDYWIFDDGAARRPLGSTAVAGRSYVDYLDSGLRYDEIRPGNFDPAARLQDMDADGVTAAVLYPSVTLRGAEVYGDDPQLQLECIRAYNDWIAEFCGHAPKRLIGQAVLPTSGVKDAIGETERAAANGLRGVILSRMPNGSHSSQAEDDDFWACVEERDVPVAIHIGSFLRDTRGHVGSGWRERLGYVANAKAGGQTLPVVCDLLFAGFCERYPRLKIVLVEANIGWIPTLLEQTDDMFRRFRWLTGAANEMTTMPSELFLRNFWATFVIDTAGLEMRHRMNMDHVLWSTDYPHSASDWPNSRVQIDSQLRGLPVDDVEKVLYRNAAALYGLSDPRT